MSLNVKNPLGNFFEDKRRAALGIIAFGFLSIGAAGEWLVADGPAHATAGVLFRAGTLLAVLWIAWPDLKKLPVWLMLSLLGGVVAVSYLGSRKIVIPFVLGAIVMLALLRPRRRFGEERRK